LLHRQILVALLVFVAGHSAADAKAVTVAIDVGHSAQNPGATSARGEGEFFFNSRLSSEVERAMQAQAGTAVAITHSVRDSAHAAGAIVCAIDTIRETIEGMAVEVNAVVMGTRVVDQELSGLDRLAAAFVDRFAA